MNRFMEFGLVWVGTNPIGMNPISGDLLLMQDTAKPSNHLIVSGAYLHADSFSLFLDSIMSLDTFAVDSVGIWYGFTNAADFSDTAHTLWVSPQALFTDASGNRYSKQFRESRLNGDTAPIRSGFSHGR